MLKFKLFDFLDKLLLLLAMGIFLFVGFFGIRQARNLTAMSSQSRQMLSDSKVDCEYYEAKLERPELLEWKRPRGQSKGEDWVFDVFTPPVIYYNPVTAEFTVTPPSFEAKTIVEAPKLRFDLELLEVRQRPYRLQLLGYAGDEGDYVAYFEYEPTGDMLLARADELIVEAGVKVLSIGVQRMQVDQEGLTPVYQNVGVARVLDYDSGEEIFLTNMETKIFSDLEAKVRSTVNGETFVVREGGQIEHNNGYYIVGDLSSDPEEAMITRISEEGDRRQSKLLMPISSQRDTSSDFTEEIENSPFSIRPSLNSRPNS
ncbi:hypothetical protein MLD52_10810 [Puniceicoccaceae bacterium K14]|nr:hypothetical protein [Puniceicoccaceae bacterium K14]